MKDELNFSYNGGGYAYLLQSVAIHFNITLYLYVYEDTSVNWPSLSEPAH